MKFRVGRIVYLAFSRDETIMGFAFPKEEREMLVASEPDKFQMPRQSDMRYHWVHVRLDALDEQEAHELVVDAWRMVVPKRVASGTSRELNADNFERNGHALDEPRGTASAVTGGSVG